MRWRRRSATGSLHARCDISIRHYLQPCEGVIVGVHRVLNFVAETKEEWRRYEGVCPEKTLRS